MNRRGHSPEFRAFRAVTAVLTVAVLARCGVGCEQEPALPMDPIAESCADFVMRDSIIVIPDKQQRDAEDDQKEQTTPVVAEVSHPITAKTDAGQTKEIAKLAECYFDDSKQGMMAAIAGGTDNSKTTFRLKLTTPPQEKHDEALDMADELQVSEQLMEKAVKASKKAGLDTVVVPVQPKIKTPKDGSIHAVQKGDTLTAIGKLNDVSVGQLQAQNSSTVTDTIYPGQILQVPKSLHDSAPVDPTEQRKKAIANFIDQFGEDFLQKLDGKLPVDAVISQAMKESAFGLSELAVNAHNFFGIKANKAWKGEVYTKRTSEEKSPHEAKLCVANDKSCKIERKLDNGNFVVSLDASFRKYDSLSACLDDYLKKIDDMYPDAAQADSAHYAALLVDRNEPDENVWATDSRYADGLEALRELTTPILDVFKSNKEKPDEPQPTTPEQPKASKYPIAAMDKVPVSEKFMDTLQHISLSKEGYERVTNSIFDATKIVDAHPNGNRFHNIPNGPHKVEMITNHFTDALLGDTDPAKFAVHYLNGANGKGMHFAIMRDGTVVRFVSADLKDRPGHNPPYSNISIGIELDSDSQDNILPEQLESLIYMNWFILGQENLRDRPLYDTVQGHSRLRMADGIVIGSSDASGKTGSYQPRTDFPRRETEAMQDVMLRAIAAGILPQN